MGVQSRADRVNKSFILDASLAFTKDDAVIFQDGARAIPLVFGTVMARIAATGKYVPFTDETATNGTAQPVAIYMGEDILAADIVAGDVDDVLMLIGGTVLGDINRLVIENGKLLTTVIAAASIAAKTVEDALQDKGIFFGASANSTSFEN